MAKHDFCFTFYDGDATRDMSHMNRLERGAYIDFIISQRKFGHLDLSFITKAFGYDFDKVWDSVKLVTKVDESGKYFIEWLDVAIKKMLKHSEHQSVNGKLGGRPVKSSKPKQNPNKTQTKPECIEIETQSIPTENPLGDGNGNGSKEGGMGETDFDKFWIAYPKKKSKGNAEKWWEKHKPSKDLLNAMLKKIEELKNTDGWKKENGQFIPYPASWLNSSGWEDEVEIKVEPPKSTKRITAADIFPLANQ